LSSKVELERTIEATNQMIDESQKQMDDALNVLNKLQNTLG
jgi:hypothetical protein